MEANKRITRTLAKGKCLPLVAMPNSRAHISTGERTESRAPGMVQRTKTLPILCSAREGPRRIGSSNYRGLHLTKSRAISASSKTHSGAGWLCTFAHDRRHKYNHASLQPLDE